MASGNSSTRIDLFVVADAVLISLACVLIFLAYREINAAPVRQAKAMAQTMLMASDDFTDGDLLGTMRLGDEGRFELASRLGAARNKIGKFRSDARLGIFSTHPNFAELSEPADAFLAAALSEVQAGRAGILGRTERDGPVSYFRAVVPLRAARDCRDCAALGVADYQAGDIIGLREARVQIGDEYARIIGMLLYAFAILATALMCVLGVIFPMIKRVREERTKMSDLAVSLERQATTDPLTGLYNRRYFEKALASYLKEFNEIGCPLGLLIFDLDYFKQINDTHGHDAGDMVLREVAFRLKSITRENDIVARIGGEEFAVITPYARHDQLLAIAERYREIISSLKVDIGRGIVLRPTISVGVATNSGDGVESAQLFKAADRKLYEAKRTGRNRVAA